MQLRITRAVPPNHRLCDSAHCPLSEPPNPPRTTPWYTKRRPRRALSTPCSLVLGRKPMSGLFPSNPASTLESELAEKSSANGSVWCSGITGSLSAAGHSSDIGWTLCGAQPFCMQSIPLSKLKWKHSIRDAKHNMGSIAKCLDGTLVRGKGPQATEAWHFIVSGRCPWILNCHCWKRQSPFTMILRMRADLPSRAHPWRISRALDSSRSMEDPLRRRDWLADANPGSVGSAMGTQSELPPEAPCQ